MINVSLPPQLEQIVRNQVATGQFDNESDVIAAAIRLFSRYGVSSEEHKPRRRSPRGILADLHNDISSEDILEARREMWGGLMNDEAT
jgi:putative addiction module CopG family antidote